MPEPSPFYRQHVALDEPVVDANTANRPWWSVVSRVDQLLADKAITVAQWRTFAVFRTLVEIAYPGSFRTQRFERLGGKHTLSDPTAANVRTITAARHLVAVRERIGAHHFEVLLAHALVNAKWRVLAKAFRIHPATMRRWTIAALQRLAAR